MTTLWAADVTAQSMSRNDVFGRFQQVLWQERDGLPQNTVLAIATTRDGYLRMGTYEGAVRFDGAALRSSTAAPRPVSATRW